VASPGPHARAGAHPVDLGAPQLIDSFANGWPVTQADLAAVGGASFVVHLTWTPQRKVWIALALSGATLLLCLVLGFLPERWRSRIRSRWRRVRGGLSLRRGRSGRSGEVVESGETVPAFAHVDTGPRLVFLHREPRHRVHWWNAILLGLITGVIAAGVTSLRVGAGIAVLVIAGLLIPWVRWVAAFGAVGFITAGCVNVVRGQAVHHYLPGSNWAGSFVAAGNRIWLGVVLLLADAVIVSAGARSPRPAPPANAEPSPPT